MLYFNVYFIINCNKCIDQLNVIQVLYRCSILNEQCWCICFLLPYYLKLKPTKMLIEKPLKKKIR